jgi:endonuclease YncB( thermonuclease family)
VGSNPTPAAFPVSMQVVDPSAQFASLLRSKLADVLWRARSRKGKALVIVAGPLTLFIAIGIAFPPDDEPAANAVQDAEASPEPATPETAEVEATSEEQPALPSPPLRVARVIDGDTLELRNGETVRLVQIDAPETDTECYASKSTKELRNLLPRGMEVRLESDPRLDARDRCGRLLRYLFEGGTNVNLVLVKRGPASVWVLPGGPWPLLARAQAGCRYCSSAGTRCLGSLQGERQLPRFVDGQGEAGA